MPGRTKERAIVFMRGWGFPILVTVLVITSFRSAVADWNDIPSGSMRPTLVEGDRILVNKLAYDLKFPFTTHHLAAWDNPRRGDVVIFFSPADGRRLVKRVIGLPATPWPCARTGSTSTGQPSPMRPCRARAFPT